MDDKLFQRLKEYKLTETSISEVEKMIDDYVGARGEVGFIEVLELMAQQAYKISEHALSNWQDKVLSKYWENLARRIESFTASIKGSFKVEKGE